MSNCDILKEFKCEICEYIATSNTVLNAHMTRQHKLKKLRVSSSPCESLKLSPPPTLQEDIDTTLSPSSPLSLYITPAYESIHTTIKC